MDWTIFWAIIAVLLAAAGLAVSGFIYRRQNPKRKLRYGLSQSQLLRVASNQIKILFEDKVVHNAYSTALYIYSESRADIGSNSFDSGRPLIFDFGDDIISASVTSRNSLEYEIEGSVLRIPPQLIRKRTGASFTLIHDGRTRLCIVSNPLIDIEVDGGADAQLQPPRGTRALTALLIAASSMAVVVAGLLVAVFAFNVF